MNGITLELAGETLTARPDAALHWPRARTTFIADLHLGKATTFRRFGIPVPERAADDIARLDTLITETDPQHLVILGDLLHARLGRTEPIMVALTEWRARHPSLHILLVRGNHDRSAGDPPPSLDIEIVNAPHQLSPFTLLHEPDPPSPLDGEGGRVRRGGRGRVRGSPPSSPTHPLNPSIPHSHNGHPSPHSLAAHLHPAVRLRDPATRASIRLRCFHVSPTLTILPAFGSFTGAKTVRPARDDRVLAITDDRTTITDVTPALATT